MKKANFILFVLVVLIGVSFGSYAVNLQVFKPCSYSCDYDQSSYYGSNYYDLSNSLSNKYNKLLGKFNVSQIVIENGKNSRNGFVCLGFNNGNSNSFKFLDIGVEFINGEIHAMSMNNGGGQLYDEKIGTYSIGQQNASDISYIDMTAYLKKENQKDMLYVDYTIYDNEWKTVSKNYSYDVTGYFKYNKGYYVVPFNFVSLVPQPNQDVEHNDGSSLKNVEFYAGKYDSKGKLFPFNSGKITQKCSENLTVKYSKYNSNVTLYKVSIQN